MSGFEKTNWDWQIEQFQRRLGEWLEVHFFPIAEQTLKEMNWTISDWLVNAIVGLAWSILGAAIAWTIWQVFQTMRPYLEANGWLKARGDRDATLPDIPAAPASEWVRRAQAYARANDYREACRALYTAMLQRLHEADVIPQKASRTDGEYLHLLRRIPRWQIYQELLHAHEALCFNDAVLSKPVFDRCDRAYQELDRDLDRELARDRKRLSQQP